MPSATYKLLRVVAGRTYFAEVAVVIEPAASTSISVAPDAFAWLKLEHGPDAHEGPAQDDYRAGAVFGVEYAFAHLTRPSAPASCSVTFIRTSPVDTDRDAVAAAACHATWKALGDGGSHHPEFGAQGVTFDIRTPTR